MTAARYRWLDRIKQVEREYLAAAVAAELLDEKLQRDSAFLEPRQLKPADAGRMRNELESTYLIRLFSVFEAGLREAWAVALGQRTEPRARDLVDGMAARRDIPAEIVRAVHLIRDYRNSYVHGGEADSVSMNDARRYLNRYFARLPEDW